jgi:hypothetical protein
MMKEQKAMKAMKALLCKYNLEEDADKLGASVQSLEDIAFVTQDTVEYFKLKGTVAQYMDIVRNETGKEPEAIKAEYVKSSTKSQKRK